MDLITYFIIKAHGLFDGVFRESDVYIIQESLSIKQAFIESGLISSSRQYKELEQGLRVNGYPIRDFIETEGAMIEKGDTIILSIGKRASEFRLFQYL